MRLLMMWLTVILVLPLAFAQDVLHPGTPVLFRINSGGPGFTDSFGNVWQADSNFVGTQSRTHTDTSASSISNVANAAAATTDQVLYKSERWGPVQYRFANLASGIYTVHIHLAEIFPGAFSAGARQFRINVEGTDPFGTIDLAANPGPLTATVRATQISVTDGILNLNWQQIVENPKVSGIVVFAPSSGPPPPPPPPPPGTAPTFTTTAPTVRPMINRALVYNVAASTGSTLSNPTRPAAGTTVFTVGSGTASNTATLTFTPALSQAGATVTFTIRATANVGGLTRDQTFSLVVDNAFYRVNCGGPLFTESSGIQWLQDNGATSNPFSNTGSFFSDATATINRAADSTVPNQVLTSHRWDANDGAANELTYSFPVSNGAYSVDLLVAEIWPGAQTAGVRIYSVTAENQPFVTNLDMTATAGFRTLIVRTMNVQVTDGVLNVRFLHGTENPAVNALRIRPGCPTGQTMCSGSCVPTPCGGCGGPVCTASQTCCTGSAGQRVCCNSGQVCTGGVCAAPSQCQAPFVASGSDCVYPNTGGSCPRNEVDCIKGCASGATATNPFTICTGGQCRNGVCVKRTLTPGDVTAITGAITTFFNAQTAAEAAAATATGPVRIGDFVGGLVRAIFHDAGPTRTARACLWVRDIVSEGCPGRPCEFLQGHNTGLAATVRQWHNFYIDTLVGGNTLISTISLQDFVYLAGAVGLKIASGNNPNLNIPYRWNRAPCQCLNIRPFQACGTGGIPVPPNAPGSMPEPEHPFSTLTNIMETQMGFTRREWNCLLGAHTLGRCDARNTGYARNWVTTASSFNNQYWQDMLNIVWVREAGDQNAPVTNADIPTTGREQFRSQGSATHGGTVMLNADMNMFWTLESNANCDVTHTGAGCPQRLPEFNLVNEMQNLNNFYNCFAPAFQKMSEMGGGAALRNPGVAP